MDEPVTDDWLSEGDVLHILDPNGMEYYLTVTLIGWGVGGPEDFVTEENGILIPVDDAAALTDAMEHMMLHRREYDSASIAADIRRKFAPETIAARLTEIYTAVLENRGH